MPGLMRVMSGTDAAALVLGSVVLAGRTDRFGGAPSASAACPAGPATSRWMTWSRVRRGSWPVSSVRSGSSGWRRARSSQFAGDGWSRGLVAVAAVLLALRARGYGSKRSRHTVALIAAVLPGLALVAWALTSGFAPTETLGGALVAGRGRVLVQHRPTLLRRRLPVSATWWRASRCSRAAPLVSRRPRPLRESPQPALGQWFDRESASVCQARARRCDLARGLTPVSGERGPA